MRRAVVAAWGMPCPASVTAAGEEQPGRGDNNGELSVKGIFSIYSVSLR